MEKKIRYDKYDSGNAFFLSILSPQVVGILLVCLISLVCTLFGLDYKSVSANDYVNAFVAVSAQLAFVVVFFVYNRATKTNWVKATGINKKINWMYVLIGIAISFACIYGFNGFVGVFDELLEFIGYVPLTEWPIPINNAGWFVFNLVFLAIMPAIFEELLFRGIIFNGLKNYNKYIAIFGSAGLFALLHGNASQLLYPFILGVILAYVVYKTGNVLYSIIIHMVNNIISICYQFAGVLSGETNVDISYTVGEIFMYIGIAVVTGVAIWLVIRYLIKKEKPQEIGLDDIKSEPVEVKQKNTSNKLLWYGIIFGVILWIIDFVSVIAGTGGV